jgi:cytochrome P450
MSGHPAADGVRREPSRLGSTLRLSDVDRDPVGVAAGLRAAEPVSWLSADDVWLVSSYRLVDEVHRDRRRFITDLDTSEIRQIFGVTMLTVDGPSHRDHRRPFDSTLRHQHIQDNYAATIRSCAVELLRSLAGSGHGELMSELADPLGLRIVSEILGFECDDDTALRNLIADVVEANRVTVDSDVRARAAAFRRRFAPTVLAALERAATTAPQSVLGMLARTRDDTLTDEMIVDNTLNLVFGGADPVAILVGTTIWALLEHPDQLAEVRADRSLIALAVDEAARWHPPFGLSVRYAAHDLELDAAQIRGGDKLYAMIIGANRDPEVFAEPDRFDLRRSDLRSSVSFGRGMHFCIGQGLSRIAACEALDAVLDELPGLALTQSTEPTGFDFHRLPHLHVAFEPSPA